jgi:bifunctional non-homologous end joining protein LigD
MALAKSEKQYVQKINTVTRKLLRSFKRANPAPIPDYIEPLFPALQENPPSGERWVHEIKFDGYRFQMHLRDTVERIFTRRGHDWTHKARAIAAVAYDLPTFSAIIDGEVVVLNADGTTDFNELERELGKGDSDRLTFFAFDVPYLDGYDLRDETLLNRKEALKILLQGFENSPVEYSEHLEGNALRMKQDACGFGLEGIVSKLKESRYVSGRSDLWVKSTCRRRDTFAIVGWAEKGRKFDGFYLGEATGKKLEYAGKVEGGWTEQQKNELLEMVKLFYTDRQPLTEKIDKPKAKWVEPRVLVDVEYRARTKASGLLRHPSFKGVRRDLMEESSRRERPPRAKRASRSRTGRA